MPTKKRKYGDQWKAVIADSSEVAQMNDIFDRFVAQPISAPIEVDQKSAEIAIAPQATVAQDNPEPLPEATVDIQTRDAQETTVVPQATVAAQTTVVTVAMVRGELRLPHYILDCLPEILGPYAMLVYLRLFRLSHGYGKDCCRVGYEKLSKTLSLGKRTVIRAVERLETFGLIRREGAEFGDNSRGNNYRILLPTTVATETRVATPATVVREARIKEDLKNKIIKTAAYISKEQAGAHPDQIVEMVRLELGRQGIVVEREEIRGVIF